MVYRAPRAAPLSRVGEPRRGRVLGRFCLACGAVYSTHAARHRGKPLYGKDHVASPCLHEGQEFLPGDGWWEPAVEVLPEAPPVAVAEAPRQGG